MASPALVLDGVSKRYGARVAVDGLSLEARGGEIIGGRVAAMVSAYPEIGFDVDKVADLETARIVSSEK